MQECINIAMQENNNDEKFKLYCSLYPLMNEKTFISFEEFKDDDKKETKEVVQPKKKSVEDIMKMVSRIAKSTLKKK